MRSIGRSLLNVAALSAVGLVPMLVAVSCLKAVAADGTVVWELPEFPTVSLTIGPKPERAQRGVIVVTPPMPPPKPPARRASHVDV